MNTQCNIIVGMIDIYEKALDAIKEELQDIEDGEIGFVKDEEGNTKFVILAKEDFEVLEESKAILDEAKEVSENNVKIISNTMPDISYEEYEKLKQQLLDSFEKTFKPKPEKLN